MITNEPYPGHRSDDDDDAHETDSPESRVARAWDALEQIHNRVAELEPEASEQEIAAHVGDYVADTLLHDANQAAADDRIIAEEADLLQDDGTKALLQGGVEDDLSISLDENPITHVAEAGHDALLADEATEISREDAEIGTQAAILLGRAQEHIDRTRLNVPPRPQQQEHLQHRERQPNEGGDESQPAGESMPSPEGAAMEERIEHLKADYRGELRTLFTDCLNDLSDAECTLILDNPDIRTRVAFALWEFGVETSTIGIEPRDTRGKYHSSSTEVQALAERIAANAHKVNDDFQNEAEAIAHATGVVYMRGPVKEAQRIAEKLETDYGASTADIGTLAAEVKDAVRCRLIIESDPFVTDQPIIHAIKESHMTIATDRHGDPVIKRGWWNKHTGEPIDTSTDGRYRDSKVTVTVVVHDEQGDEVLCEIVIATPEMAAATMAEHPLYELLRSLPEGMPGDEDTLVALRASLIATSVTFYRSVHAEIQRRLNGS